MKNLFLLASLAAVSLGFSSCCSMFGNPLRDQSASYNVETMKVRACGYDTVTEEVYVGDPGGKGGMMQTVEKKVPRYKTVTKKTHISCVRHYCPAKDACGTTSESTMRMASAQGSSGSPNIGLIPTMKPLPLGPVAVTTP